MFIFNIVREQSLLLLQKL